jgi:hypothetical protein
MRRVLVSLLMCVVLVGLAPLALIGEAQGGVKVGTLKCNEAGGWGLVFGSSRDLKCVFTPAKKGEPVRYTGKVKKYGADIGYQQDAVILWAVVSAVETLEPGALAGTYVGVTAQVAWAAGLGANVLVGGFKKNFALQPVSVVGLTGANVAAGLTEVELKAVKQ